MREASYTSLRLGLYGPIKHAMGLKPDSNFVLKVTHHPSPTTPTRIRLFAAPTWLC